MSSHADQQYTDDVMAVDRWYDRERARLNVNYFLGEFDSLDSFNDARRQLARGAADRLADAHRSYLDRNPDAVRIVA